MTTRKILYGEKYSFDEIVEFCKDEKIEKDTAKIGFRY
jgi:hypothetical protein